MKIVPLYEGAEEKSYYKFLQEIEHVSGEEVARIKAIKTDPSLPPAFADRAIVQTPAYTPVPEGVYLLNDGTIFVSAVTPAPDLTGEMMEWWMIWHQLDPLRYALWNPEDHYDVKISDETRAQILDDRLPIRERGWGISCTISESMNGEKPAWGTLNFVEPAWAGFDNTLIGTDSCQFMLVANNVQEIGPLKYPILMCEMVRKSAEGKNEWVVAAWMGHGIKDGEEICFKLPKTVRAKLASEMPSMFIVHNHKEIGHLNKVLPAIYADQKDNWLE